MPNKRNLILFSLICFLSSICAFSQDDGTTVEHDSVKTERVFKGFTVDTPPTIDLKKEEEDTVQIKKKKRKKNVFYGFKTRKGFTKKGFGEDIVIEQFHFLKEPQPIDPFVRDVYWFDIQSKKIKKSRKIDEKYGRILHGPYKKILGDQVLEEGIFYVGTKHGRWMRHNKRDLLMDKQKYLKGWPKESEITYYDEGRTRLKEITPIEYGKKEGYYYYFHDNGQLAVRGEYQDGERVGVWREYHKFRRKQKKEIQYKEDPYNENFTPFIVKEWDKDGKVVYDRAKDK